MRRAASSITVATLLCLIPPAGADVGGITDRRDTSGPQDIRVIEHSHGRPTAKGAATVRFVIESHRPWRTRRLQCSRQSSKCRSIFNIYVTTDERRDIERQIQVFKRDGEVMATVSRYSDSTCVAPGTLCWQESRFEGRGRFWRPDRRSFVVTVPVRMLGRRVETYGWRVWLAFYRDRPCPEYSSETGNQEWGDYVCSDYAPEPNRAYRRYRWIWHTL
ncbi:MAG: hypothetical protein ACRDKT_03085 [Actinomycetota bacterium]